MTHSRLTNIVWDNPLSYDASLPTSQCFAFFIHEDAVEAFLLEAYGYIPQSFNFEREACE